MTRMEKRRGWDRLARALSSSLKGLRRVYTEEAAFRQELVVFLPLVLLAFFVGRSYLEVTILVIVSVLVLIVEILNSAVEAVVDRIGLDFHDLSGLAKDLGSAAVFVTLLLAALVWGGFFYTLLW
jgi:diacylglycerol kinase (ATP)